MGVKVTLQGFEVRVRALAGYEAQLHEPARRIVDEPQHRTRSTAVHEQTMVADVDLHQFAVALTLKAGNALEGNHALNFAATDNLCRNLWSSFAWSPGGAARNSDAVRYLGNPNRHEIAHVPRSQCWTRTGRSQLASRYRLSSDESQPALHCGYAAQQKAFYKPYKNHRTTKKREVKPEGNQQCN